MHYEQVKVAGLLLSNENVNVIAFLRPLPVSQLVGPVEELGANRAFMLLYERLLMQYPSTVKYTCRRAWTSMFHEYEPADAHEMRYCRFDRREEQGHFFFNSCSADSQCRRFLRSITVALTSCRMMENLVYLQTKLANGENSSNMSWNKSCRASRSAKWWEKQLVVLELPADIRILNDGVRNTEDLLGPKCKKITVTTLKMWFSTKLDLQHRLIVTQ